MVKSGFYMAKCCVMVKLIYSTLMTTLCCHSIMTSRDELRGRTGYETLLKTRDTEQERVEMTFLENP